MGRMRLKYLVSKTSKDDAFQIKQMIAARTCSRDKMNRCLVYDFLAKRYSETFRGDPEWKTSSIICHVKQDLKSNISQILY